MAGSVPARLDIERRFKRTCRVWPRHPCAEEFGVIDHRVVTPT